MTTYIVIGVLIVIILLVCFCLAIASFSSENYVDKLRENQKRPNSARIDIFEYVNQINENCFNNSLRIAKCKKNQDHYTSGIVALSEETMSSNSLASMSIVSHELGHARQDKEANKLKKHWKMRRNGKICGMFFMPVLLSGATLCLLYLLSILTQTYLILGLSLVSLAVLIFLFAIFLKYKEIKIEKEASVFAIEFLKNILNKEEIKLCKEFLDSALLTYWATLFKTLLGWTFLTKKDSMFR